MMSIEDTSKLGLVWPFDPAQIEQQERRGAEEMADADVLPVEVRDDPLAAYEALGFIFGEPLGEDPLFRQASLPPGWSRRRTGHDMWTEIVDERGARRVDISYKAACYDRRAFMRLVDE